MLAMLTDVGQKLAKRTGQIAGRVSIIEAELISELKESNEYLRNSGKVKEKGVSKNTKAAISYA